VIRDYRLVATRLGTPGGALAVDSPAALLKTYPEAHLPNLEDAFALLVERSVLLPAQGGGHTWGPNARAVADLTRLSVAPDRTFVPAPDDFSVAGPTALDADYEELE